MATRLSSRSRLSEEKRAALRTQFKAANQNLKWLADHYATVRKEHAGLFIVVWKRDVVATGASMKAATSAARRKHVPVEDALLQYVPAKDETFVF